MNFSKCKTDSVLLFRKYANSFFMNSIVVYIKSDPDSPELMVHNACYEQHPAKRRETAGNRSYWHVSKNILLQFSA